MTDVDPIRLSAEAWDRGHRADSLTLLKEAIRSDPSRSDIRRTLAERYREMGNPDQAGRWGITLQDWTTARERDRLARLLASCRIDERSAPEFFALAPGALPESIAVVLSTPTEKYRERFALTAASRNPEPASVLVPMTTVAWCLWFIVGVGGAYAVFGFALFGMASSMMARTIGLVTIGLFAVALALSGALALRSKAWGWAIGWILSALVTGSLTVWQSHSAFVFR